MSIVFLDTEATGLGPADEIWEVAARRRDDDGTVEDLHMFVRHSASRAQYLPAPFFLDWSLRYDHDRAKQPSEVARRIQQFTLSATIVGAVPNFDTEKLASLMRFHDREPKWHYHLVDVENLVVGFLAGSSRSGTGGFLSTITPPWNSEDLSRAVGVNPDDFERHTAMGDVLWAEALYDTVMNHGR